MNLKLCFKLLQSILDDFALWIFDEKLAFTRQADVKILATITETEEDFVSGHPDSVHACNASQ